MLPQEMFHAPDCHDEEAFCGEVLANKQQGMGSLPIFFGHFVRYSDFKDARKEDCSC